MPLFHDAMPLFLSTMPLLIKKTWRLVLLIFFLQTICKIAWSKGDNSSELSNFYAIVKIKKKADCRQKEKKKGGDEESRNSLMPKPNEIVQQVYKMIHPP
jgi:hypothetical protein